MGSGQNTQTATNLNASLHYVTVTDHNGCICNDFITITQPTPISITLIADFAICYGEPDGSIYATPSGGTPPYSYLWSNKQTGQNLINVVAKVYCFTVTDKNGCKDLACIKMFQPTQLTSHVVAADTILPCYGNNNGTITIAVVGGSPPFKYIWNNGDTTLTIINLSGPETYCITITDNHGCVNTHCAFVSQPSELFVQILSHDAQCLDSCTGEVTSAVTGATLTWKSTVFITIMHGATIALLRISPDYVQAFMTLRLLISMDVQKHLAILLALTLRLLPVSPHRPQQDKFL